MQSPTHYKNTRHVTQEYLIPISISISIHLHVTSKSSKSNEPLRQAFQKPTYASSKPNQKETKQGRLTKPHMRSEITHHHPAIRVPSKGNLVALVCLSSTYHITSWNQKSISPVFQDSRLRNRTPWLLWDMLDLMWCNLDLTPCYRTV